MIELSPPTLQVDFAFALKEVRERMLMNALQSCVRGINLKILDSQLHKYGEAASLKRLAIFGIRGELLFAVPCVVEAYPELLGYYRLLLGYSQKSFYTKESGISLFKSMEERGTISAGQKSLLTELCVALCRSAAALINGLEDHMLNHQFLDSLSLLTLGPQLRGGANVKRGAVAITQVFHIIHDIVKNNIIRSSKEQIEIKNASGRVVYIEFASDPDIVIREKIRENSYRNLIAIEVKGGQDYSNIHNRIGEAEKSHQKARLSGYVECWTVVNVDRTNTDIAKKESPSTNRFFHMSGLCDSSSEEWQIFNDLVISSVGVK
jgi:hypothetical protein